MDADAKFVVTTVDRYDAIKEACALTKTSIRIATMRLRATEVLPEGAIDFAELINPDGVDFSALNRPNTTIEDIAFLPYSSGTTGLPKGVQLTHRNITSNCEMLKATTDGIPIVHQTTPDYQEVLPCVLPFFHIYGLTVTLLSKMNLGCKLVTLPRFHPDSFLNAMAKYKGSVLHLVPPISKFKIFDSFSKIISHNLHNNVVLSTRHQSKRLLFGHKHQIVDYREVFNAKLRDCLYLFY